MFPGGDPLFDYLVITDQLDDFLGNKEQEQIKVEDNFEDKQNDEESSISEEDNN